MNCRNCWLDFKLRACFRWWRQIQISRSAVIGTFNIPTNSDTENTGGKQQRILMKNDKDLIKEVFFNKMMIDLWHRKNGPRNLWKIDCWHNNGSFDVCCHHPWLTVALNSTSGRSVLENIKIVCFSCSFVEQVWRLLNHRTTYQL